MKIAVPTSQGFVDDHLTCCECFVIYTVDEHYRIVSQEPYIPASDGCCVISPIATLRQRGVSVVLTGNVDSIMLGKISGFGMQVHKNYHGESDLVVRSYLEKIGTATLESGQVCHIDKHHDN